MSFDGILAKRLPVKRIVIAISLLLLGSIFSNLHVSAVSMDHTGVQASQGCINSCTTNNSTSPQPELIVVQEKKDTPAPPLHQPYYLQFQNLDYTVPQQPRSLIFNSSFRPPDLNRQSSVFRF